MTYEKRNSKGELIAGEVYESASYLDPASQAKRDVIEAPIFVKHPLNPVFVRDDAKWLKDGGYKLYFPCLVHARPVLKDKARAEFYMYYSSDHAVGDGGIGLAVAEKPEGPWIDYGMVYVDNVDPDGAGPLVVGDQTETPSVIWNPDTNLFHMYYHNRGNDSSRTIGSQATCLATSPDGINWTKYGTAPVLKIPDYEFPGDGHTGYARVFRMGKLWVAYHLAGGTDYSHSGISTSKDGIVWQLHPEPFNGRADLAEDSAARKMSLPTCLFMYKGNFWSIIVSQQYSSGVVSYDKTAYAAMHTALNRVSMLKKVFSVGGPGEWDEADVNYALGVVEWKGKLYLMYQSHGVDGNGAFGLVTAEVA